MFDGGNPERPQGGGRPALILAWHRGERQGPAKLLSLALGLLLRQRGLLEQVADHPWSLPQREGPPGQDSDHASDKIRQDRGCPGDDRCGRGRPRGEGQPRQGLGGVCQLVSGLAIIDFFHALCFFLCAYLQIIFNLYIFVHNL